MSEMKVNKKPTNAKTEQNISSSKVDRSNVSKEEKMYRQKEDYESNVFPNT